MRHIPNRHAELLKPSDELLKLTIISQLPRHQTLSTRDSISSSTLTATYPIAHQENEAFTAPKERPLVSSMHKPQTATWHASRRLTDTLVYGTAPHRRWIPWTLGGLARPTTQEHRASGWDEWIPPSEGGFLRRTNET